MLSSKGSFFQSTYRILLLILAGESIFLLPFVLSRIFRPTFLAVFELTNYQLGVCFSIYGMVALFSYLYGGVLADMFSPRKLIATALFLTGVGGLYLATYPSYFQLKLLFGYWGFTTIFLFWGAMIKATRVWGGAAQQGRAFGYLEGGRGIVAATLGATGVLIFSLFLPETVESSSLFQRQFAFRYVVLFTSGLVFCIAVLTFFGLREREPQHALDERPKISLTAVKQVMHYKSVYLLMLIVLCAYVGYKVTDIFSLYAAEIIRFNEVDAAKVGAFQMYLRPIVCVLAGFLADKTRTSIWLIVGFVFLGSGALIFASGIISEGLPFLFICSMIVVLIGTYGLRTLYFSAFQEGKIPMALTGTAVGLVSVLGYTPDIFMGPLMGYFLDTYPGINGHRRVFVTLALFSTIGGWAAYRFHRLNASTRLKNESLKQ